MGGRGSAGGTRSTYRGDSTAQFNERQRASLFNQGVQQGDSGNGGGGGGGKTEKKSQTSANTGGIQTGGGGGNGGGGGGAVVDNTAQDTVTKQPLPPDADLEALFEESEIFEELIDKYPGDKEFNRNRPIFYKRWLDTFDTDDKAPGAAPSLPFRKKDNLSREGQALIDDIEAVNPRYDGDDEDGTGETSQNCQRCAVAVEFRAQGYDVTAQPLSEGWRRRGFDADGKIKPSTVTFGEIARMWADAYGKPGEWSKTTKGNSRLKQLAQLETDIKSWPEGARGFIGIDYTSGGSHIFNFEVRNGEVYYIDGQTDKHGPSMFTDDEGKYNWKFAFSAKSDIWYMRVDDKKPNDNALTWVRERTIEEKNAPTATELGEWLEQVYPDDMPGLTTEQIEYLRDAFSEGWQAVRTGQTPAMPAEYSDTPIVVQAWEAGITWARRPD